MASGQETGERASFTTFHYQAPVQDDDPKDLNDLKNSKDSKDSKESTHSDPEVARLLDKIKREGYSSLTQEEKDRLFKH